MRPVLQRYPRKTVRIAVEHLRRNATAIANRAEYDEIIIVRCGKPRWVIVRHDYYTRLEALAAGNLSLGRTGLRLGRRYHGSR